MILASIALIAIFALFIQSRRMLVTEYAPVQFKALPPEILPNNPAPGRRNYCRHRAIAICPGENACAKAMELKEKRFLVADGIVPNLPIKGCDADKCTCNYLRYRDRRSIMDERRKSGATADETSFGTERRTQRGRRIIDQV